MPFFLVPRTRDFPSKYNKKVQAKLFRKSVEEVGLNLKTEKELCKENFKYF